MRVPVVSNGESWKRKRTKLLRGLKEGTTEFLYLFSPWRKTLQLIAGESAGEHGFLAYLVDLRGLLSHRKLRRRRPVLLRAAAIPGVAQFFLLFADRRIRPGPQHRLQLRRDRLC